MKIPKKFYKIGTKNGNTRYTWACNPTVAALNIWNKHRETAQEFFIKTGELWKKCMPI